MTRGRSTIEKSTLLILLSFSKHSTHSHVQKTKLLDGLGVRHILTKQIPLSSFSLTFLRNVFVMYYQYFLLPKMEPLSICVFILST